MTNIEADIDRARRAFLYTEQRPPIYLYLGNQSFEAFKVIVGKPFALDPNSLMHMGMHIINNETHVAVGG